MQDNGASIKLNDEKILMINVQDVNDNLPEFDEVSDKYLYYYSHFIDKETSCDITFEN